MDINAFPNEILDKILEYVVADEEKGGVRYSYGLSQLPKSVDPKVPTNVQRYVKGPLPPYQQKWDATNSLRNVCVRWHEWALSYALREVYVKLWRGSERWCDLSIQREKYPLYELIDKPTGERVYRDPYSTLRRTRRLIEASSYAASNVRRVWFNGLYVPETDVDVIAILRSCVNLTSASIPWTVLRHGTPQDWAAILGTKNSLPLQSLELLAVSPSAQQSRQIRDVAMASPLDHRMVDFSSLRRLKLFGNTDTLPVCDDDLKAIARTATNIEEFQLTCISTVTIEGVMAIVQASRKTLRVLEHSPRSDDGFWHPHPGTLSDGSHICSILASCPRLEDISVSIPSMCTELFSNTSVRWHGDCQVRALALCGHEHSGRSNQAFQELKKLLDQARNLILTRGSGSMPAELTLELFFAEMIFDPHLRSVHGDFQEAEEVSSGLWPGVKSLSGKGPYGSTGLYGKKEEEGLFSCIDEEELFVGLARKFVSL